MHDDVLPVNANDNVRMNVVRHFSIPMKQETEHGSEHEHEKEVSFTLSAVDYVFELRVPRLQMTAAARTSKGPGAGEREKEKKEKLLKTGGGDTVNVKNEVKEKGGDEERKQLRREIKRWWEGVADHMDSLVCTIPFTYSRALVLMTSTDLRRRRWCSLKARIRCRFVKPCLACRR
jgi:hypothetical protein